MTKSFGEVIRILLDESGVFDRAGWATVCDVKETDFEAWVENRQLPPPNKLRALLDIVRQYSASEPRSAAAIQEWEKIADLPIGESTSFSDVHLPVRISSLAMYQVWPKCEGLLRRIAILSEGDQERFLEHVAVEINKPEWISKYDKPKVSGFH